MICFDLVCFESAFFVLISRMLPSLVAVSTRFQNVKSTRNRRAVLVHDWGPNPISRPCGGVKMATQFFRYFQERRDGNSK